MTKRLLLVCVCLSLQVPGLAQGTLAGTYTVEGKNADDSTYTGRAEVEEADGLIRVTMRDDQPEPMSVGLGLREGNVISLVFQTREGIIGMASYRIDGDTWIGRWFVPGHPVLTETLQKVDPRLHGADQGPKSIL